MRLEDLKQKVDGILAQFQREELGNRVTNFSSSALRFFILEKFDEAIKEEVRDGEKENI